MILKNRTKPVELIILQSLRVRSRLDPADALRLENLDKGYAGEVQFDNRLSAAGWNGLLINDLLLDYRGTLFQIDSLLLQPDAVYLFDVKNYFGDFFLEDGKWISEYKEKEVKNPLLQLKRTDFAFRSLLKDLGFSPLIRSNLVFINPEFHLFQAPRDLPAIFHSQLNRFLSRIGRKSAAPPSYRDDALAQKLLSLHVEDNPYARIPRYEEQDLRKGIYCPGCFRFYSAQHQKRNVVCSTCGYRESNTEAVLRTIEEFHVLFPDKRIQTQRVVEWCGILDQRTVRRILGKHFVRQGKANASIYVNSDPI
ncbi:nuclease-related domain-containing protein [Alteribacter lacisalsi]|uniref:nuclease-related domain-containing protein n=1 Tax=Alteribacter lacisalsi TaxID=2045244 RepID=UPI001374ABBA|nr:nuclease-related domain-containing protein [Alteribacter lacisalsi]